MGLQRAALGLALALAACAGERKAPVRVDDRPPPVAPPAAGATTAGAVFMRGTVRIVPTLTFRSCDGQILATAYDSTGDRLVPAYRVLRPNDDDGMYAEALAARTPNGEVILRRLEYASRPEPGQGCDQSSAEHLLRAYGVKPQWRVLITGNGIEFTQTEAPTFLSFPAVQPDDSGGILRYQAPGGFHMLLIQSPCTVDSTSTFGSMQAVVEVAGKTFRGCASNGRGR